MPRKIDPEIKPRESDYKALRADGIKRRLEAWRLRHEGLTFREVGLHLKTPVSASRARQLFMSGARIARHYHKIDVEGGYLCGLKD